MKVRQDKMGTGTAAVIDRLTARAAEEGLLDVAYTSTDSPFGPLLLAKTSRGLVRVGLPNQDSDELLVDLAERVSPRVLESPRDLDEVRRELDLYFEGKLDSFDLPLDWRLSGGFRQRVLRAINRIPYGQTRSYTEMARKAGNERAVRAAGTACGSNPIPLVVPCHRVLRTGGALGGYGGGLPMKRALLELEGVLDGTSSPWSQARSARGAGHSGVR
jgi:methylated-DNA-[protein]-cysteine S-methyltransferase